MATTDKNMTFDVNLLPATTGDHNLGSSDLKWNLFVNQINGTAPVTGVKGNAESSYRTGNVNLTAANIGAVALTGDTMTGNLIAPSIRIANTYYGITFGRTTATPVETILHTGIKWVNQKHMPVIHVTGYAYGLQSPVEFKIGFYIYGNKIGYCGVTNMGAWQPNVFLFKDNHDSHDYVGVGLAGSCYFLQLQADLQDEMGKFAFTDTDSSKWSWTFSTTTGVIPAADDGTTCIQVPYKANILNPSKVNGHTVEANVPSNAKFTDTTALTSMTGTLAIEHGGTNATTAADARTNLGLGNVENTALSTWAGTSNITTVGTISTGTWQGTAIAASYIGSHSTDKLTSGTLPVARGGTGITTSTYKNAVLVGNSSTVTNAFHTIRTANGAFYATAQDGAPSFGTLPVAQGGTGQTSIANIKAGKDGDGNTISSTYLKLSGGTMTGKITSTANIGLTIRPTSDRAYLRLFPATDTPSDIAFGRGTTNTWSLSARDSSAGYFGLYNHIIPSWAFTVSESSNNVDFNGQISTKYITVNATDSNTEGGEIKLAGAPGYQSGQYYACLDVNSQDFRIHSKGAARLWLNLTNGNLRVTGYLQPDNAVEVARGGTGASTAPAARNNLGVYTWSYTFTPPAGVTQLGAWLITDWINNSNITSANSIIIGMSGTPQVEIMAAEATTGKYRFTYRNVQGLAQPYKVNFVCINP